MVYIIEEKYEKIVLNYLSDKQGKWTGLWDRDFEYSEDHPEHTDVSYCFPVGYPRILQLTIMRRLQRKGLVGGCPCGCRGDFEITDEGLKLIGKKRYEDYNGY